MEPWSMFGLALVGENGAHVSLALPRACCAQKLPASAGGLPSAQKALCLAGASAQAMQPPVGGAACFTITS
jgi:hypothetical protein